jgi:hypothetical protein
MIISINKINLSELPLINVLFLVASLPLGFIPVAIIFSVHPDPMDKFILNRNIAVATKTDKKWIKEYPFVISIGAIFIEEFIIFRSNLPVWDITTYVGLIIASMGMWLGIILRTDSPYIISCYELLKWVLLRKIDEIEKILILTNQDRLEIEYEELMNTIDDRLITEEANDYWMDNYLVKGIKSLEKFFKYYGIRFNRKCQ